MQKTGVIDITVLMTVYNGGGFLKKSVESVLAQTFDNFEFLIVDDCSTDNTASVIESYNDSRIVLYKNAANQGQTRSLNTGLREARGEYIARMDADDMAFPDWLEKLYRFAKNNSEYSVVSCQSIIIDEDDKIKFVTEAPDSYQEVILKNIMESSINHVGSLMRREDIVKEGGYDDNYRIVADYDLWTRLLIKKYKLVNINEILTATRIHGVSATSRGKNTRDLEIVDVMQKNLANFTNSALTKEDLGILWKILHNIKDCVDEAGMAEKLINSVYGSLKPELGLPGDLAQKIKEGKKKQILKKRIFVLLQNGKHDLARDVLKEYIRANGWFNFFGLIYFLSFFPIFTRNIESMYYRSLNLITNARSGAAVERFKNKVLAARPDQRKAGLI